MRAIAVVGLLFVAGCGTPALPGGPGSVLGPSPDKEGETWDFQELTAHLNKNGLKVKTQKTIMGGLHGPAVQMFRDTPEGEAAARKDPPSGAVNVVYTQKRKSMQDAKDEASTKPDASYSWGRFLFESPDKKLLEEIRKSLGG